MQADEIQVGDNWRIIDNGDRLTFERLGNGIAGEVDKWDGFTEPGQAIMDPIAIVEDGEATGRIFVEMESNGHKVLVPYPDR